MIEQYMPLARKLASRYRGGKEPLEDLVQVAYVGLVKAVDRFDPAYERQFSSFAIPTIVGELRRHFRDMTWTLHVPRGVQEAALQLSRVSGDLTDQLGRAPTVAELAQATGLEIEQVLDAMSARAAQHTSSLDCPHRGGEDGSATLAELIGSEDDRIDLIEHQATVEPLIRSLPEREREILVMRFGRDMTQTAIAQHVGCSQMQISRILHATLARLSQVSDEPQDLPRRASRAQPRASHRGRRT